MSQRQRVLIIGIGVVVGIAMGIVYKDMYKCLVTGILVSSAITVMLSRQAKQTTGR